MSHAPISTATRTRSKAGQPRFPQLQDPAWLREQYEMEGRSTRDIAAELGCAKSLIDHYMRSHGIARRSDGHPPVHGGTNKPTWRSWASMLTRCTNPNQHKWPHYGGRGISVCDRWAEKDGKGFLNFLADMGERPAAMTLDRIDPNGNYEPSNCRWADAQTQRANRRDSRH